MVEGLVEQLVDAGLITEAQARASDVGDPVWPLARVVQRLIDGGLDERVLAGFFVSRGFGPILHARELSGADDDLVRSLPGSNAHDLCAMPLRRSPAGAIVAMAAPTDQRAIARLSEVLGGRILPTVAKLSDLQAAIDRAYPTERPTLRTDPLPMSLASTASPVWDRAWSRSTTEREVSSTRASGTLPLPIVSHSPPATAPPPEVSAATPRPTTTSDSATDIQIAELGRVTSRDDVVHVACQACLGAARSAAFLALRKGVFRGWDGAGEEMTSAGIRSLWVPASNPSILNEVLHSGRVFRGAYGQTAADQLCRAALGPQSREIVVVPVMIGRRLVGVLCASDPAVDTGAIERVAEAMSQAFERLIVSHKAGA